MRRALTLALAFATACAAPAPYEGGRVLLLVDTAPELRDGVQCVELRFFDTAGADSFVELAELTDAAGEVALVAVSDAGLPVRYGVVPSVDEAGRSFLVEARAYAEPCDERSEPALGLARLVTEHVVGERRVAWLRIEAGCACERRFETCDAFGECVAADLRAESLWLDDAAPGHPCVTDADCDDRRTCNGVERCVGGACVAGAEPVRCGRFEVCSNRADPDPCVCAERDLDDDGECGVRVTCERPDEVPDASFSRCVRCGRDAIEALGPAHLWSFGGPLGRDEPATPPELAGRGLSQQSGGGLAFAEGASPLIAEDIPLQTPLDAFTLSFWLLAYPDLPCGAVVLSMEATEAGGGLTTPFVLLELTYGQECSSDEGFVLRVLPDYISTPIVSGRESRGRWRMATLVVDGEASEIGLFIDGELVQFTSELLIGPALELADNIRTVRVALGNRASAEPGTAFVGEIDEISFFYRRLDEREVRTLYEAPVCRPPEACPWVDGETSPAPCVPAPSCEAQRLVIATEPLPSGAYWVDPDGAGGEPAFVAHCDMETSGGGWTLALVQSDDGEETWECNDWACGYEPQASSVDCAEAFHRDFEAGAFDRANLDYGSPAASRLPFRDLMVRHRRVDGGGSSRWLVHEGVDDGSRSFASMLAAIDAAGACDVDSVCVRAPATRADAPVPICDAPGQACLCDDALYLLRDGICGVYPAYLGPDAGGACPPTGARGPDAWAEIGPRPDRGSFESSSLGFGEPLGLNPPTRTERGDTYVEVWLR